MILPTLLHQDCNLQSGSYFQSSSDLDLASLPLYACKIPSVIFFPYVTYFAGTWGANHPSLLIPKQPLNRTMGINWLHNSALHPYDLMNGGFEDIVLRWINNKTNNVEGEIKIEEIKWVASAVKTYLLDEIRYVYDENKSAFDSRKSSRPSRYLFSSEMSKVNVTKEYLSWYIDQFSHFFERLVNIGKQDNPEERTKCFIAGLTMSRLAIEAMTILSTDIPIIRKWQFFDFLDMTANFINSIKGIPPSPQNDKTKVLEILSDEFYEKDIVPVLNMIPVKNIRNELISHTQNIFNKIKEMKVEVNNRKQSFSRTGPEVLWAYRNTHHGYSLNKKDQDTLIFHNGRIFDDLPDLTIALWHYILLKFPFN